MTSKEAILDQTVEQLELMGKAIAALRLEHLPSHEDVRPPGPRAAGGDAPAAVRNGATHRRDRRRADLGRLIRAQ